MIFVDYIVYYSFNSCLEFYLIDNDVFDWVDPVGWQDDGSLRFAACPKCRRTQGRCENCTYRHRRL